MIKELGEGSRLSLWWQRFQNIAVLVCSEFTATHLFIVGLNIYTLGCAVKFHRPLFTMD